MVNCPICGQVIQQTNINAHIDSGCKSFLEADHSPVQPHQNGKPQKSGNVSSFFAKPSAPRSVSFKKQADAQNHHSVQPGTNDTLSKPPLKGGVSPFEPLPANGVKRALSSDIYESAKQEDAPSPAQKRAKPNAFEKAQPLAERMRPKDLNDVCGQELVGPSGILRSLIEQDRVPSMILWGGPGTGKTTIARLIAKTAGTRFVEINSTSSGVGECKKLFAEAKNELGLTGRKTIIFCDEIHRFSKSQQDVFLGPVESGQVTLIGATTENPSFKVVDALLSRCRTFTLSKLTDADIITILQRALNAEQACIPTHSSLLNSSFLTYLAAFSDGDARTALNLLELAMDLSARPNITQEELKRSLTHTLVYDRAGDQHYDTISAFHKSIRGSDPDAALYYLARMLQSGEDALYIARRMVVIASEDIGLADNTMLPLATAAYTAAEKVGLPEARINLAHVTVALALSKKSTRAYRGLGNAMAALREPGIAGLPVPINLRNAPTKLMKELGYGAEYKYNPDYLDGKVVQQYFPETLKGRKFLEEKDLGDKQDLDLRLEEAIQ